MTILIFIAQHPPLVMLIAATASVIFAGRV
jgi:hypothetical protein